MTSLATGILVFRLLAVSQVVLAAAALAMSSNPGRTRLLGILLMLCALSYLISSPVFVDVGLNIGRWLALPADVIPPLLFFFTWHLLEDDRKLPAVVWALAAVYLALALWLGLAFSTPSAVANAWVLVPVQVIKLGFALGAVCIVWRDWQHKGAERRLKPRHVFVGSVGVLVLAVIVTELATAWDAPQRTDLLVMAAVFVVALMVNLAFLRRNPSFILKEPRAPMPVPPKDKLLVDELARAMRDERIYVDHDLRIADLAARLRVSEDRLRRTINRSLGYRNFNQFVNAYRIDAAARQLLEEPRTPVLTVALEVGFRSISSFNAAFRACYGKTPTEYRRSKPMESAER